jgi:hypothetical protein
MLAHPAGPDGGDHVAERGVSMRSVASTVAKVLTVETGAKSRTGRRAAA